MQLAGTPGMSNLGFNFYFNPLLCPMSAMLTLFQSPGLIVISLFTAWVLGTSS